MKIENLLMLLSGLIFYAFQAAVNITSKPLLGSENVCSAFINIIQSSVYAVIGTLLIMYSLEILKIRK